MGRPALMRQLSCVLFISAVNKFIAQYSNRYNPKKF